ncbi:hypothetical protein [Pseudomonas antarctica]|uniref:hypothetical protein n=1 Tax=Pseudomonas antarctica TaxID=219572 RepID=UPI001E4E21ED|nr:hypothetical protein [Pseudomonas antarctica]
MPNKPALSLLMVNVLRVTLPSTKRTGFIKLKYATWSDMLLICRRWRLGLINLNGTR